MASAGTGSDGWNGTEPTSNACITIGPITVDGTYTYTRTCTGPGGTSSPTSVTVTAGSTPPPATIGSFALAPAAIPTGQSTTLTWSTRNGTACTATGGPGSDGWSGAQPTGSAETVLGPIGVACTYTYTLTCSGPGGPSVPRSIQLTVSGATQPASVTSFTATPAAIQTGQSTLLGSFTLSCSGPAGTGSGSVVVTVISSIAADCGGLPPPCCSHPHRPHRVRYTVYV